MKRRLAAAQPAAAGAGPFRLTGGEAEQHCVAQHAALARRPGSPASAPVAGLSRRQPRPRASGTALWFGRIADIVPASR